MTAQGDKNPAPAPTLDDRVQALPSQVAHLAVRVSTIADEPTRLAFAELAQIIGTLLAVILAEHRRR
jgi:hypothetical protein